MWEFLGKASSNASDFFKNNADTLKGVGALVSGGAGLYGAIQQGKQAEKNYKLNLDILKAERKRQQQAQRSLNDAWNQSLFNNLKIDKKDEGAQI